MAENQKTRSLPGLGVQWSKVQQIQIQGKYKYKENTNTRKDTTTEGGEFAF